MSTKVSSEACIDAEADESVEVGVGARRTPKSAKSGTGVNTAKTSMTATPPKPAKVAKSGKGPKSPKPSNASFDGPGREPVVLPHRRKRSRPSGERRVQQILDAVIRLIGTEGPSAVTHRAVAELASVPLGSMTYYFTDLDDLLLQAMLHAMEVEGNRLTAIVDAHEGEANLDSAVDLLTQMFFDKTVADPLYDLALFEMFMDATRRPQVRSLTRQWTAMIGQLVDRVLPPTDPAVSRDQAVQLVAALIDGLMLEEVANHSLGLRSLSDHLRLAIAPLLA